MPPKLARLLDVYRQHLGVPWQAGLAAIQRVMFLVHDKEDELKLRANLGEFEITTAQAGKKWLLLDITDAFPTWLASQEYRDESPRLSRRLRTLRGLEHEQVAEVRTRGA